MSSPEMSVSKVQKAYTYDEEKGNRSGSASAKRAGRCVCKVEKGREGRQKMGQNGKGKRQRKGRQAQRGQVQAGVWQVVGWGRRKRSACGKRCVCVAGRQQKCECVGSCSAPKDMLLCVGVCRCGACVQCEGIW